MREVKWGLRQQISSGFVLANSSVFVIPADDKKTECFSSFNTAEITTIKAEKRPKCICFYSDATVIVKAQVMKQQILTHPEHVYQFSSGFLFKVMIM